MVGRIGRNLFNTKTLSNIAQDDDQATKNAAPRRGMMVANYSNAALIQIKAPIQGKKRLFGLDKACLKVESPLLDTHLLAWTRTGI